MPSASRRLAVRGALLAAVLAAAFPAHRASAQTPGSLDTNFAPLVSNLTVFTVGLQLNNLGAERIFAGGDNRLLQTYLLNGTMDTSFQDVGTFGGANRIVYIHAFETTMPGTEFGTSDSRIYIGGLFGQFVSTDIRANIRRLNSDGTLDTTFDPGLGAQGEVTAILPDGGVGGGLLVGGVFNTFNEQPHNHLVRLNADGSVNTTYNPALQTADTVFVLAHQIDPATGLPNGQSLVGGTFGQINGGKPSILARLNADGTVDGGFNPSFNPNLPNRVLAIAVQPDGKILVGGIFGKVNGLSANNVLRLNQDGSTDTSFVGSITGNVEPVNAPPTAVNAIKVQPDGRIFVAGNFTEADGVRRNNLARFEADGTLDASFDPGEVLQNTVQSIAVQSDNNLVVGETRINQADPVTTHFPNTLVRLFGGPLLPAEVSITAVKANARKGAKPDGAGLKKGRFLLTRTLPIVNPLTVYYTLGGNGRFVRDYILPNDPAKSATDTNSVTFPANAATVDIPLLPKGNSPINVIQRDVTLTLSPNSGYTVGPQNSATVTIRPPIVP